MTWTKENSFDRSTGAQFPPSWPNEMLVKILSTNRFCTFDNLNENVKVCEIGSFSGSNLRFFLDKNFVTYGVEINQEMVELGVQNLVRLGYIPPTIVIGDNTNIPHPDAFFDLLVSINTLHYSWENESNLAIKEFARVVKPGGYAVIETAGQKHFAVKGALRHGLLNYEWKSGGFRQSTKFGFFDSIEHYRNELLKEFSNVEICTRIENYPDVELEFMLAICKK
jgi:SAM-dependent methyltransferase